MLKIILFSLLSFSTLLPVESIYNYSVTSIEGINKPLSDYQGKKMLIITLPVQENISNDSLLHSLDSIRAIYSDSLVIIGVPSYEDGYTPSIKNSLNQWYRSILGQDIIITDGLYTRKTSGNQQHPLFQWLTDKNKNGHFDKDVEGSRQKFFVWTDGDLMGVLGPQTRIGGGAVNSLLQSE
jgi:glutathione peroxidase